MEVARAGGVGEQKVPLPISTNKLDFDAELLIILPNSMAGDRSELNG